MSLTRAIALAAAATLVLSSCSGGDDEPSGGASASESPAASSTVKIPDRVALTEPGSDLTFGDSANVVYEPNQKSGTVLTLTVTKAEQGSVKDFSGFVLDDYTKKATPYYVDVTVENLGEGDVGGAPVPLWGVDADNTLLPAATFTATFPTCESKPLPSRFPTGKTFDTCLVFLAPDGGTLEAVSFRPNQEFDPIQWTGTIGKHKAEKEKSTKKSDKKKR